MNDILRILLLAVFTEITLSALFLTLHIFFPDFLSRVRLQTESTPGRAFLLGVVNTVFLGGIAVVLISIGGDIPGVLAVLVLSLGGIGMTFGLGGLVRIAGEHLLPGTSGFKQVLAGTGVLFLACLTPFLGWFGLLPYLALLGLGACVGALRQKG
ncbi:MAG: hypothetical protein D6755_12195 [Anaerolineae bacterium]|nr:MAG: hypothetical protein D6755_12195 [Anaerolineae bacterium]